MRCPVCVEQGTPSTLTRRSSGSVMHPVHVEPFYDEQGRYHLHDMSIIETEWECSNGHRLTVTSATPCPTCGVLYQENITFDG